MNLLARKLIGVATRPFYPGYSHCAHCGRAWPVCRAHYLPIGDGESCVALCVDCNADLTPEQKLPHYQRVMTKWANQHTTNEDYEAAADVIEHTWPVVRTAVTEGK